MNDKSESELRLDPYWFYGKPDFGFDPKTVLIIVAAIRLRQSLDDNGLNKLPIVKNLTNDLTQLIDYLSASQFQCLLNEKFAAGVFG